MRNGQAGVAGSRVHVPKTSEVVASQIRAQIVRGELQEGSNLPPVAQLLETFGISLPTFREAVRILEAERLLSMGRGSRTGPTVHRPSVDLVSRYAGYVLESQGTTIADLYEGRLALEPSVVRSLAMRKDVATTKRLRDLVTQLTTLIEEQRLDEFIDLLEVFHQVLVEGSGSKTLVFMSRMFLNLAGQHQREYYRRHPEMRDNGLATLRVGLKSYEKLIALIEAGNVDEAVSHWRLHLENASKTWAGAGEGTRVVDSLGG